MPSQTPTTTPASTSVQAPMLKVKTHVKAGGINLRNHNETLVRATPPPKGLQVKTRIKAGSPTIPIPPV